jgi:hypothetical protein
LFASLDKKISVKKEGVEFGFSLSTKLPELAGGNAATLSDFLYTATITESPRPSQDEIDDYIDNVENIEAVFDEVLKELEESNAGKLAGKNAQTESSGTDKSGNRSADGN